MYERAVDKTEEQAKKSYFCLYLTVALLNVILIIIYALVIQMATEEGALNISPNPVIIKSAMVQPQTQAVSLFDEAIKAVNLTIMTPGLLSSFSH